MKKSKAKTHAKTPKDPVCGMDIKTKDPGSKSHYDGSTFYFCSSQCKDRFDNDPRQFTGKKAG